MSKFSQSSSKKVAAPSSCTVYISNLPFSLTNTDISQIFEKHGLIARVTILRDKERRESKGVAFIQFKSSEAANACVEATNGQLMFQRTLKSNIAKDNGRAPEFIKRREYPDKSRCYECGEFGHLSYSCPKNVLGVKEPPQKKRKFKSKNKSDNFQGNEEDNDEEEEEAPFEEESLSAAIQYQQELREAENMQFSNFSLNSTNSKPVKRIKKSAYFSDEEELSD